MQTLFSAREESLAFWLRLGLGLVFIIGGWNKLYQLLDPALRGGLVGAYTGGDGYINQFFLDFLFAGGGLSPADFLVILSGFELVAGLCLAAGFLVRPLALIFGLILWGFVIALPVLTTPGVESAAATYQAPALLVQARDVALSGLMFLLFNMGAGALALDNRLLPGAAGPAGTRWKHLGLLLRLSLAFPLLVGGVFHGMNDIMSFHAPGWLLIIIGTMAALSIGSRPAALGVMALMLWYIGGKIEFGASLIANLNGVKREIAFFAAGYVLARAGGAAHFSLGTMIDAVRGAFRPRRRARLRP